MEEEDCDQDFANRKANSMILPKARKTLRQLFVDHIIWMYEKRQVPLMNAILKKCEGLHQEGFTHHKAIKAAVSNRKYQIYEMIQFIESQPDSDPDS